MNAHAHPAPSNLSRIGGSIGIAAVFVSIGLFLLACHGYERAFALAILPLGASLVGLLLTVLGATGSRKPADDSVVVPGYFINIFALVGGLIEYAVYHDWAIMVRGQ